MDIPEKEFLRLLKAANTKVWRHDRRTNMIFFFEDSFTLGPGEPIEEHMQLKHPDDFSTIVDSMKAFDDPECNFTTLKYRYLDPTQEDGVRYIDAFVIPVRDENGNVIITYGSERDVTERVSQINKLHHQSNQIQLLLQYCKTMLWTIDIVHDTLTLNQGEEVLVDRMPLKDFVNRIDPEGREDTLAAIRAMKHRTSRKILFDFRGNIRKAGSPWLTWRFVGIPDRMNQNGKIETYTGIAINITEWDDRERALIKQTENAEEKSRRKSLFVANASHDIRTPLNGILGVAQLLCEDLPKEEREELYPILKSNSDILLNLINDILDISKIEAGKMEFSPIRFSLQEILASVCHNFEMSIHSTQTFTFSGPKKDAILGFDKQRLVQVINNFMSNAFKFAPEGNITLRCTFSKKEGLYVEVADTGIGISEENQGRVFQQFQHFAAGFQGTGLGLSICKAIIEAQGGTIGFKSEEGKGSAFWFRLPYSSLEPKDEYPEDEHYF